ncbi:MAG: 16S rRNA (cytidine(1402)-2'-O)-methyltransferase [Candidatus Marinimicrobia bacterium]|nr:16S rRNA (cytidine(1402)-2'-O)-methyltransferase [Candidatus Neomarinimicrobiota bacterium]MCF7850053.1 16S rRNA (cytidine(1402)-2'-O)-methyltransferase [Candidatus Neomarinimicrobiota bacterium]MCF7904877.1 16S rRNA (cytidine(1402)-2'-O)-methyltransferase [Candidatus Neomarinimicrobiota bacterium]
MPSGTLYVVSTPIGNLGDFTFRAVDTLKAVDLIAAEDTRVSGVLLKHYSISTPMLPYHDHNKVQATPGLIRKLEKGDDVGLITDAGTPMVSDPGFYLVREALRNDISVIPIPGASAVLAGLVASGLPSDRFTFEGFLPRKKGRQSRFKQLAECRKTIILYESPHRIGRTLKDIAEHLGDRPVVIAREITKKYEEFIRGSVSQVREQLDTRSIKGEVVILIGEQK